VYAVLPKPYLARLDQALRDLDVYVQNIYEGAASIGEQRRVLSIIGRPPMAPAVPRRTRAHRVARRRRQRLRLGRAAHGLLRGRLRHDRILPVASTDWLIDSRGLDEIREHG
jgi:hypothetical protein